MSWRWLTMVLMVATLLPVAARAQMATPASAFGVAARSPVAVRDQLLTTPLPATWLPAGVPALAVSPWDDANDRDLAGAIGGVIYAADDPFGPEVPLGITYIVYPDRAGADRMRDIAGETGTPIEVPLTGEPAPVLPAIQTDLDVAIAVFLAVDNVFVIGMAPTGGALDAEETAAQLARAGTLHLLAIADGLAMATPSPPPVTPAGPETVAIDSATVVAALAAAPFPTAALPVTVGDVIVVPDARRSGAGVVGWLTVRDATREYPYPLLEYRIYADFERARLASQPGAGDNVTVTEIELAEGLIGWRRVAAAAAATTVQTAVGPVVVSSTTYGDDAEARAAQAVAQVDVGVAQVWTVLATLGGTPPAR